MVISRMSFVDIELGTGIRAPAPLAFESNEITSVEGCESGAPSPARMHREGGRIRHTDASKHFAEADSGAPIGEGRSIGAGGAPYPT